jgi:formate hydrogenlyase subunit 4
MLYLMLNISSFLELIFDWLITTLYFFINIKYIFMYLVSNEWHGPNIYETEMYKLFNSIKLEYFAWINSIYSTKNDVLLTIYYIFVNFPDTNTISIPNVISNNFTSSILSSIILGIKSSLMIFVFIWARASLPRIRFDQLMSFCWTVLLPIVVAFIIIVPCILYAFDILPNNIILL